MLARTRGRARIANAPRITANATTVLSNAPTPLYAIWQDAWEFSW
ncbi:hypothetical protein [Micromonospora polyrhachis]|uniref:Uncharacterized protein n=1 Tax=Micromonospora polyrhachis TaxID=1282883 RepID=A0A7W7SNJ1_9ACTN|nr:hypothetical protein [Micromonospora polyrhachis]MBB4957477.1 hypothetical protein [Micromonospora polyrhachis]